MLTGALIGMLFMAIITCLLTASSPQSFGNLRKIIQLVEAPFTRNVHGFNKIDAKPDPGGTHFHFRQSNAGGRNRADTGAWH